jgi:hypothetical protein
LFVNRLAFSEDGRDDYLCAEHYVMMGNWDRDPDRYPRLQRSGLRFLRSLYGQETATGETIDSWMNVRRKMRVRWWAAERPTNPRTKAGPGRTAGGLGAAPRR